MWKKWEIAIVLLKEPACLSLNGISIEQKESHNQIYHCHPTSGMGGGKSFFIFPCSFLQPRYFLNQTALPFFLSWEVCQMLVWKSPVFQMDVGRGKNVRAWVFCLKLAVALLQLLWKKWRSRWTVYLLGLLYSPLVFHVTAFKFSLLVSALYDKLNIIKSGVRVV